MICTTNECQEEATRVIAWPMRIRVMFVAAYCDEHAADIECDMGGLPACGPALSSPEVESIQGMANAGL